MADVSKIKATNGTVYDIKDSNARAGLATKLDATLKGASNGVAELDTNGKVPIAQIDYLGLYLDEDGDLC